VAKEWVDHGVPGSHLIWDVQNSGTEPVTLTKLVVRGPRGKETTMGLELPHVLTPRTGSCCECRLSCRSDASVHSG